MDHGKMIKVLEMGIMTGVLTPAKVVASDSLVCLTGMQLDGNLSYHQVEFATLPEDHKRVLLNQKKGFQIGPWKIVGIFDVWEPDHKVQTEEIKPEYN